MSTQAVIAASKLPIDDHRELLAAVMLANHYNDETGRCDPGQETVAREAHCDARTLRRYLAKWKKAGWIERKHRYNAKGKRTSDSYTLLFLERTTGQDRQESGSPKATTTTGQHESPVVLPDTTGHTWSPVYMNP
jgi:hypothetical protein